MSKHNQSPYRVESRHEGCENCGASEQYDIVLAVPGQEETAMSQSWGDEDEANDICELLNAAYALGRGVDPETAPASTENTPAEAKTK